MKDSNRKKPNNQRQPTLPGPRPTDLCEECRAVNSGVCRDNIARGYCLRKFTRKVEDGHVGPRDAF